MIVRTRRQHRVLAEMQHALLGSDPRLVARFALFTRLTEDEDIPPFERVRGWIGRRAVMIIRRRPRPRGLWRRRGRPALGLWPGRGRLAHLGLGGRGGAWGLSGLLIVPALAATMAGLLFFTGSGRPAPPCAPARAARSYANLHAGPRTGRKPPPACPAKPLPISVGGR